MSTENPKEVLEVANRGRTKTPETEAEMESRGPRELTGQFYVALQSGRYHTEKECAMQKNGMTVEMGAGDVEESGFDPCLLCASEGDVYITNEGKAWHTESQCSVTVRSDVQPKSVAREDVKADSRYEKCTKCVPNDSDN